MRRTLVNTLAFIGALTVIVSLAGFALRRYAGGSAAAGVVLGPQDHPAVGAPVFLDRGHAAIERYVTDSRGRFSFPLKKGELRRAKWLICVPGGIPMVDYPDEDRFGPMTYSFTPQPQGRPAFIRSSGWLAPIPRECPPALDSVGWRYPAAAGKDPSAFTIVEPDWNAYRH